jgi:mannosyltransferase
MALPRSMRVLAALTVVIFFYMVMQIFRAPTELQGPGEKASTGKIQQWDHDPQLDGMILSVVFFSVAHAD